MNRFPIDGVEVWRNEKNGFVVFQLHYSANPTKKDPAYRETVKAAMPIRQYMQEYELQWDSYAGTPVYPDFQRSLHGSKESLDAVIGLPLLRGWDFGLTPACVIAQYVDGQLRVLREYTAINKGAEQFSQEVLAECRVRYPQWSDPKNQWRDVIDPAGNQRKDTDMVTCAQILARRGLFPAPGPVTWEARRSAVEHFLTRQSKRGQSFRIALPDCPVLARGFEGGYRYDEKALDVEPAKVRPIKDEHSHPHDALQYICATVRQWTKPKVVHVPGPSYAWSSSRNGRTMVKGRDING